jgi:hypothetical protein
MGGFAFLFYSINKAKVDRRQFNKKLKSLKKLNNVGRLPAKYSYKRRIEVLKKYFSEKFVDMIGLTREEVDKQVYTLTSSEMHNFLRHEFEKMYAIPVARGVKLISLAESSILCDLIDLFHVFDFHLRVVRVSPNEDLKEIVEPYIKSKEKETYDFRIKVLNNITNFHRPRLEYREKYLEQLKIYFKPILSIGDENA